MLYFCENQVATAVWLSEGCFSAFGSENWAIVHVARAIQCDSDRG